MACAIKLAQMAILSEQTHHLTTNLCLVDAMMSPHLNPCDGLWRITHTLDMKTWMAKVQPRKQVLSTKEDMQRKVSRARKGGGAGGGR